MWRRAGSGHDALCELNLLVDGNSLPHDNRTLDISYINKYVNK